MFVLSCRCISCVLIIILFNRNTIALYTNSATSFYTNCCKEFRFCSEGNGIKTNIQIKLSLPSVRKLSVDVIIRNKNIRNKMSNVASLQATSEILSCACRRLATPTWPANAIMISRFRKFIQWCIVIYKPISVNSHYIKYICLHKF